jgi:hypothetical protein
LAAIPEVVSWNVILMSPPSNGWICNSIKKIRKWDFNNISRKNFNREVMVNEIASLYELLI